MEKPLKKTKSYELTEKKIQFVDEMHEKTRLPKSVIVNTAIGKLYTDFASGKTITADQE